jgi:Zn-finger protein
MKNLLTREDHCKFFPCHKGINPEDFDCTFCYCPIYPCGIKETGGKWITGNSGDAIWDCTGCNIIHRKDVVKKIKSKIRDIIYEEATKE